MIYRRCNINNSTFEELRQHVLDNINLSNNISDEELHRVIDESILSYSNHSYLSLKDKCYYHKKIMNSLRGLDILQDLVDDPSISEIMVNGPKDIFIEKNGVITKTDLTFESPERLHNIIQQIVSYSNRRVNEMSPITDARLKDGSRVNIVLNPIAMDGPAITIRKFQNAPLSIERLIALNSITKEAANFLEKLVIAGYNILISGGTSSGKTTFLNVLSNFIPKDQRVITIEDSAELSLMGVSNLVRLEMRQANLEGTGAITIRDLIRSSLRMRPDRLVIGEVRGPEALDMVQAMSTGHEGCMSSAHSNSARDMLDRLATMSLTAMDIPLAAIKSQIASAIDIVIHLSRIGSIGRRVYEICEVNYFDGTNIVLNPLYLFDMTKGLYPTGNELIHRDKLIQHGLTI